MGTWTSTRNEVHFVQVNTQFRRFFLFYSSTKSCSWGSFRIDRMKNIGCLILLLIFVFGNSLAQADSGVEPDAKLGQNKGLNVTCGKWTTRLVTVPLGPGSIAYVSSSPETERCTVTFKPTYDCSELVLYCPKFYIPNDDAYKCTKGSAFHTKADQTPVRDFCKRNGPNENFPVLANDAIKMWYNADKGYDGSFACEVRCSQPA